MGCQGGNVRLKAAYLLDRENFLARLERRGETLFEDGYTVVPDDRQGVYCVCRRDGNDARTYRVNPLDGTCTCPFFAWQELEPLSLEGEIVPCKHLRGLERLIARTLQLHREQEQFELYYSLAAHRAAAKAQCRRRAHQDSRMKRGAS